LLMIQKNSKLLQNLPKQQAQKMVEVVKALKNYKINNTFNFIFNFKLKLKIKLINLKII
jgi:hypothetical protein